MSTIGEESAISLIPKCPNGLFQFDDDCVLVEDADEEIMELYMSLASTSPELTSKGEDSKNNDSGGLGFLSATDSILELSIDLAPPSSSFPISSTMNHSSSKRGSRKAKLGVPSGKREVESVNVKIQQDIGMLKGQKGDTGSVLWRSSLYLATRVLSQKHYTGSSTTGNLIFDYDKLGQSKILELGAGTGLLSILLSQLSEKFTSSDRLENLKLVKRNLELNGIAIGNDDILEKMDNPNVNGKKISRNNGDGFRTQVEKKQKISVNLEEIDWVEIQKERNRHPELWNLTNQDREEEHYDLILAVDCIYNEHLVQPLVDTLSKYCKKGGKSVVWVVVELRSADVLTLFLESWMNDSSGPWTIIRLSEKSMGNWDGRKARWVGWVGWR
ncbi:uncharacterized protein L201_002263 [Kwoniella dendrophila CBS 6074]|uniref:Uncharacterized protein n=1 Tax=Kwoniella dendrophila CBS 6074 TaxID=1295534 RepID=A0AAX4JPT0_9TREE